MFSIKSLHAETFFLGKVRRKKDSIPTIHQICDIDESWITFKSTGRHRISNHKKIKIDKECRKSYVNYNCPDREFDAVDENSNKQITL